MFFLRVLVRYRCLYYGFSCVYGVSRDLVYTARGAPSRAVRNCGETLGPWSVHLIQVHHIVLFVTTACHFVHGFPKNYAAFCVLNTPSILHSANPLRKLHLELPSRQLHRPGLVWRSRPSFPRGALPRGRVLQYLRSLCGYFSQVSDCYRSPLLQTQQLPQLPDAKQNAVESRKKMLSIVDVRWIVSTTCASEWNVGLFSDVLTVCR